MCPRPVDRLVAAPPPPPTPSPAAAAALARGDVTSRCAESTSASLASPVCGAKADAKPSAAAAPAMALLLFVLWWELLLLLAVEAVGALPGGDLVRRLGVPAEVAAAATDILRGRWND